MKDILVHLDGDERAAHRLEHAIEIAAKFNARLIGLFARVETSGPSMVAQRLSENLSKIAEQSRKLFEDSVKQQGVNGLWMQLDHGEPGHVVAEVACRSRYTDLAIIGQWHPQSHVPAEFPEQVILQSGRPILVIPHIGAVAGFGRHITIAWNGSRESSRAVHDAMGLMRRAQEVTVLAVRDANFERVQPGDLPKLDLVDHLATHGITAKTEHLTAEDIGLMDLLLSRSFDLGADLLVMGAHSGLGLPFLRGGGTRFILRHLTLPVLMSN
ncbi:MAG TPA: universal stress protein [Rhodospirillaceae bacterium]|nr:universal stress protein [Rhodospirillaceae bacterium]